jgi:hypothetical protein
MHIRQETTCTYTEWELSSAPSNLSYQIWDFGSGVTYSGYVNLFSSMDSIFIIAFDYSKPESYDSVSQWIKMIQHLVAHRPPMLLVGIMNGVPQKKDQFRIILIL